MIDFLIVGGGIVGLMTARELAAAGARVCILERGETGREASWAGGGILSPLRPWQQPDAVSRLVQWGQTIYPRLTRELHEETGIDPEWLPSGLLIVDEQHQETAAREWAAAHGAAVDVLSADDVRRKVPALGLERSAGLWWPGIAQLRNPRLLQALKAGVTRRAIELREHCEVRRLRCEGRRVVGVDTADGAIAAGAVIVAGGAWSAGLLREAGLVLDMEPVRGQIILYAAPTGLFTPIIASREHYLIARRDGHVLVGSTVERAGFDKATTAAARDELQAAATRLVPALAGLPVVKQWAGLRPGSADGVPVIGPHPDVTGLYINTGHYRNGLSLAPGSARLLADLIFGLAPCVDPVPHLPAARLGAQARSQC